MSHEIRNRIVRFASADEKSRHAAIREQIAQELPELKEWARKAAERHREHIAVGTVLTSEEAEVLNAIDEYAAKHSLSGRGAVVREALARLLGIQIARQ